ncbi:MAG: hypothetical protein E6Q36_01725 [Chryseobacterium sp.]|nr:MAG: hypothetical protein E6Q36_01725 [Chryseobacterium sp.]
MMKKVVIIIILVSFLLISFVPFAMAAEINPTPGTYGYGSTSEFSASMQLGQASPNNGGGSNSLAPTGQNSTLPLVLAVVVVVASIGIIAISIRQSIIRPTK